MARGDFTQRTGSFLRSVNGFLKDSGKKLVFAPPDGLAVQVPGGQVADAADLSSGEMQLLTLFTFLYFGFEPEEQFAIVIDEPELSLHLAWQSRYLESVTEANPAAPGSRGAPDSRQSCSQALQTERRPIELGSLRSSDRYLGSSLPVRLDAERSFPVHLFPHIFIVPNVRFRPIADILLPF